PGPVAAGPGVGVQACRRGEVPRLRRTEMLGLTVLREQNEHARFQRLRADDGRTALPAPEVTALEAELRRTVRGEVRFDAGSRAGLTFGPDPSTHNHCTFGGLLGNDSCGSHSLICANHGRGLHTADNTHELEVLTYDGLRLRVGATAEDELTGMMPDDQDA